MKEDPSLAKRYKSIVETLELIDNIKYNFEPEYFVPNDFAVGDRFGDSDVS
jgi:hypothetical protein